MDLELPKPRPPEPFPEPKPIPYDPLLDYAPFETLKDYYGCPPAGVSRNLMTEDIVGAQANQCGIKDPMDPMVSLLLVTPFQNFREELLSFSFGTFLSYCLNFC